MKSTDLVRVVSPSVKKLLSRALVKPIDLRRYDDLSIFTDSSNNESVNPDKVYYRNYEVAQVLSGDRTRSNALDFIMEIEHNKLF